LFKLNAGLMQHKSAESSKSNSSQQSIKTAKAAALKKKETDVS
jgi:hypothetical protein